MGFQLIRYITNVIEQEFQISEFFNLISVKEIKKLFNS